MSLTTKCKIGANKFLSAFGVKIDSLTVERLEMKRLRELETAGHFEKPVFPVLRQFADCDPSRVFAEVAKHEKRFADFAATPKGGDSFALYNDYYSSPDAEVLYAIVQLCRPRKIVEVGSGNSTLLFRQAISDAGLETKLTSIDPYPRREISRHSDEIIKEKVESLGDLKRFSDLNENDILFIDSSHEVRAGGDVFFLFLRVLPFLRPGVIIHIHDIFLPYEYPREWLMVERRDWAEQCLLQALLQNSTEYEAVWAGHYFQRSQPDFNARFVHWRGNNAASLWLRKI